MRIAIAYVRRHELIFSSLVYTLEMATLSGSIDSPSTDGSTTSFPSLLPSIIQLQYRMDPITLVTLQILLKDPYSLRYFSFPLVCFYERYEVKYEMVWKKNITNFPVQIHVIRCKTNI